MFQIIRNYVLNWITERVLADLFTGTGLTPEDREAIDLKLQELFPDTIAPTSEMFVTRKVD